MTNEAMDKLIKRFVIGFVLFIVLIGTVNTVGAGYVKVVTRFGEVTGRVMSPGLNFKIPFAEGTIRYNTKKVIYETSTDEAQKGSNADYKDYPVDTNTADGQQVNIFFTVRFSVDPTKATFVAQNLGNEASLVEKVVKTESRIKLRNIPREFTAEQLYQGDGITEVQIRAFDQLKDVFESNGLVLDSVGIREIKFSEEYLNAIEAKQIEAVAVETAKNTAEKAKFQKEAKITEAEGQAEAQRLLKQDLTDVLVSKLWIEKWNGELPKVMSEGNIMDISKVLE